ncbi:MAG: UvrD-helicase domain-containing protein [Bacillota bacterium]
MRRETAFLTGEHKLPKRLVDERERRLAAEDLTKNYWVEAGAGTGKTTLLISRLLNIVLNDHAGLDQVAAITFTEKAAGELKVRLREALEQRLDTGGDRQKALITRALEELETASITTIHSFAAGLLRERPVEAAVDPRFDIISGGDLQDLLDKTWDRWLAAQLGQKAQPLERALLLGCSPDQLKQLGLTLYQQRDLVLAGSCPEPPDLLPAFQAGLADFLRRLEELIPDCLDHADQGYKLLTAVMAQGRAFTAVQARLLQERFILNAFPKIAAKGNKTRWSPPESCTRQKELCCDLADSLLKVQQSIAGRLVADLVQWLHGFLEVMETAKNGALDFQDLLLKARDLLRDVLPARQYFQQRYRFLLVDEFQDTDPLQVDLVYLLAEQVPLADAWQNVVPVPGKLFLVGDPKQSIYRFRRADIEIYQAAGNLLKSHGEKLAITQNFRTLPALIDWVNRCFSELIQPLGQYQPAYIPLQPYRDDTGEPALVLLEPSEDLAHASAAAVRAAEADAVAGWIESAVGCWPVSNSEGSERRLAYGDLALLFPTFTGLHIYEEALNRRGIPYRLEGGKRFFLREEINALKNLLTVIDNPYNQIALVAALRYWSGISDAELYRYRSVGGELSYLAAVPAGFPLIGEAFSLFQEAHHERHLHPVSALVETMLRRTWYWQRCMALPHGLQSSANLHKILEIIRAREREQPLTLQGFARWLTRVEEEAREESESLIHDPGGDVVQLLTIHKAKGLEYPAVCLVNLSGGRGGRENFLADRLKQRFYVRVNQQLTGAGFTEALEQEKHRQKAEEMRLLYVAATRARDYLILPRFQNRRGGGFWDDLAGLEQCIPELWAGARIISGAAPDIRSGPSVNTPPAETTAADQVEVMLAERRRWKETLRRVVKQGAAPGPYHSAGSLAGKTESEQAAELWADLAPPGEETHGPGYPAGGGDTLGSAFHQIMEQVVHQAPEQRTIERLAAKTAAYWGLSDHGELARLVRNALAHPLLTRVRCSDLILRELPFMLNLDGELIEGIIDLLFREERGLVVVDYKTDADTGEAHAQRWERYRRQGQVYALAVSEITGEPVSEVSFLFVRRGEVKQIEMPDPALLKASLRKILKQGG